ncbi:hypothetical protein, partial [Streptomyces californicus]|uniref:hypothetical protein n=1 Tax=Streptomyces californicus TaxID=67351 RepID=UPI003651D35F
YYDGQLHRNFAQNKQLINYELKFNGDNRIFSNLSSEENNQFVGKSDNGVTVIAGDLTASKIETQSIVHPNTWSKGIQGYEDFNKFTQSVIKHLNETFNTTIEKPTKILLIPAVTLNDSLPEENVWLFDDHWIISYPFERPFTKETLLEEEYIVSSLIPATTWKREDIYLKDLTMVTLFNSVFTTEFLQDDYNGSLAQFSIEQLRLYYPEDKVMMSTLKELERKIINKEITTTFFKDWYRLIKNENEWTSFYQLVRKEQADDSHK